MEGNKILSMFYVLKRYIDAYIDKVFASKTYILPPISPMMHFMQIAE